MPPPARAARRGLAGLGRRHPASSSRPTAEPATPPALGVAHRPLGRRRGLDRRRRTSPRSRPPGVPIERARPDKDESDTELAVRAAAPTGARRDRHRRGARRPSSRPCGRQHRPAGPRGRWPDVPSSSCTDRARVGWLRAPRADGRPATLAAGRASRRPRLAAADRDVGVDGRHHRRPRLPARRRAAAGRLDARTLQRDRGRGRAVDAPVGRRCSSSKSLLRSGHDHPAPRRSRAGDRPPRRDRHHPSPGRPARALDHRLLLPEGRHPRLHHRGVRVPRHERDDPRARRRRLGHLPAGRREQARSSARSSTCRSRSSPTRSTTSPTRTAPGSRSRTTGRPTGAPLGRTFLVDPDGRIARTWPKVKPEGHAADVLDALDELQAARVG